MGALILAILLHGFAIAGDRSLPFFQKKNITQQNDSFRDILKVYHRKNYEMALDKTLRLLEEQPKGPISETALFLVGDLQLKLAEKGQSKHLRKALSAFRTARAAYPDSENAIRSLWRIGQTYALMDLYYESLASFNRLLIKHPTSPFIPWAQLGIAETYQRWGKTRKALDAYKKINLHRISVEERGEVFTLEANLFYQLGLFEEAYKTYGKVIGKKKVSKMAPEDLFKYSESAYKARHYTRSRKLFMAYFSLYPETILTPIALSRVGETLRLEGKITLSRSITKQIRSLKIKYSDKNMIDLLSAVSDLRFIPEGKGSRTRKGRLALLEIKEKTGALLANSFLPQPYQRIILEAAELSSRHGALVNSLEIKKTLLARLSPSSLEKEVRSSFQETAGKTITQLSKEKDAMKVIDVYHRHPEIFKSRKTTDSAFLKVAISHMDIGLFSEAVKLLIPLSKNKNNSLREEALFHLTNAHYQNSDDKNAEESARVFLKSYSRSRYLPRVLEITAKVKDRQGNLDQAIREYRSWLIRYPKHRNQNRVSLLLADAYQRKGDLKPAVEIYTRIDSSFRKINKGKNKHSALHIKLADAYFRLGNYKKSAAFYKRVLKDKPKGELSDWARFQLAMSYERIGKKVQGAQLFTQLAEEAEDPLLKEFSAKKIRRKK